VKPTNVLFDGDKIVAEVKIEWHCLEDTDYMGLRKKGEVYHAECAAFYLMRNGKFVSVYQYLRELPSA
jgi:ketosteroid isomerase-like protein